jgi:hypothetical protein
MRRWAWRFAVALFGLWVVAALYSLRPVSHDPEPVSYLLSWEWGDVARHPDGSWSVTNDLGYEVEVLDGYVVSYEATAIGCSSQAGWFESVLDVFVPGVAWAGHAGSSEETVVAEVVESLTDPVSRSLGVGWTTTADYCEAHLAFGTSDPSATTLFLSLVVDGSRSIEVATELSWGTLGTLTGEAGADEFAVEIVRDLSSMFDGIDFDEADAPAIGTAVLRALSAGIVFVAA